MTDMRGKNRVVKKGGKWTERKTDRRRERQRSVERTKSRTEMIGKGQRK